VRTYLVDELRPAIDRAVTQVMNRQAPDCPPLYWTPRPERGSEGARGLVGPQYCIEGVAAVKKWAERFGLVPVETPMPGTISYHGQINALPVSVWAITDLDAFECGVRR
jgi:hypothetical protein